MKTWIALFRGINVGGHNLLPMAELRNHFESVGFESVRTYIQTGNVVFDASMETAAPLISKIGKLLKKHYPFQPDFILLTEDELYNAKRMNPFPKAASAPKTLHFFFLAEPASNADTAALDAAKADEESYALTERVFYLRAPNGVGRSKLAANAEKYLGVVSTARNYRTVSKLLAMVTEVA